MESATKSGGELAAEDTAEHADGKGEKSVWRRPGLLAYSPCGKFCRVRSCIVQLPLDKPFTMMRIFWVRQFFVGVSDRYRPETAGADGINRAIHVNAMEEIAHCHRWELRSGLKSKNLPPQTSSKRRNKAIAQPKSCARPHRFSLSSPIIPSLAR